MHRIRGYRHLLPAPLRGREEALEAPGGGGGRLLELKTVPGDTSGQGRGMFHPPPRQPHPQGAIPHRYSVREEYNLSAVDAITHTEIQFLLPVHGIRGYRHLLPAPSEGGGRRPRERPGGGGDRLAA